MKTINSRVNRVTKIAPNKVTKKDVPRLVSLTVQTSSNQKPKFYIGDCSNIVPPGPSIFYLPSAKAVITNLSDEREVCMLGRLLDIVVFPRFAFQDIVLSVKKSQLLQRGTLDLSKR